ncbi:MAG: hypothetical protein Q8S15_03010 [Erysipelotrichaceae bacterium]|nr:hypothetical protein [Erysipelotrichaceae bacterium]MDP3305022.1 hypothetical protein [Erysipelotrichaceae bacterium]
MIQARREFILYLAISVLLLAFDRTYAIFSHGVSSLNMTLMFLPVLLGGILFVTLRWIMKGWLWNHRLYRLFSYLYHSSIVVFVNGMLVRGILEIAGSDSKFLLVFHLLFGLLAGLTLLTLLLIIKGIKFKRKHK